MSKRPAGIMFILPSPPKFAIWALEDTSKAKSSWNFIHIQRRDIDCWLSKLFFLQQHFDLCGEDHPCFLCGYNFYGICELSLNWYHMKYLSSNIQSCLIFAAHLYFLFFIWSSSHLFYIWLIASIASPRGILRHLQYFAAWYLNCHLF